MEVYVLDSLLRRIDIFDKFESLIWTERFADLGDFELDLKSTFENRSIFLKGTRLAINESYRVMTVENIEDTTDDDGKEILKITGRSLEDILMDRVVKNTLSDTTSEPNWVITATPTEVARTMFDHICRVGALDLKDIIPFIQPGSTTIFAEDTIPESTTEIVWTQAPDLLYNAIKSIADAYDFGFRLVRDFDNSRLYFDIYTGNDRTTRQTELAPVVFSPDLDNIQNTTEYTTIQDSKNVAYVFSTAGFEVVTADGVDPEIAGFDRRIVVVNVNIEDGDPDPSGTMIQAGTEALAQTKAQSLFDGEINQYSTYKYGIDYQLGDLVEVRNKDGVISYKRATEQIFVSDAEGDRSYPTLTEDVFIVDDTWISYHNSPKAWIDFDAEATAWADM